MAIHGRAVARRQEATVDGWFHFALFDEPPNDHTTPHAGAVASITSLGTGNVLVSSVALAQGTNPSFSRCYRAQVQSANTRIITFDFTSGLQSPATVSNAFNSGDLISIFAVDDTEKPWLVNYSGANKDHVWRRFNLATNAFESASYTGSYNGYTTSEYKVVSGGAVMAAMYSGTSARIVKYTVAGTTVTEVSTVTFTLDNSNSLRPFHWLSDGYGASVEAGGTFKVLWVYSGGTMSKVTGLPSNGTYTTFAIPVETGHVIVGITDTATEGFFATRYSGGSFSNTSTRATFNGTVDITNQLLFDSDNSKLATWNWSNTDGALSIWDIAYTAAPITIGLDTTIVSRNVGSIAQPVRNADRWHCITAYTDQLSDIWFPSWDAFRPGQYVRGIYRQVLDDGTLSVSAPETGTLTLYDDNGTAGGDTVWSLIFTPPGGVQATTGVNFWLTADGTSGGTPIHGTYRMRIKVDNTTVPGWITDSETDNATGTPGFIRVGTYATGITVRSDAGETTSQNPFAWPDTTYFKLRTQNGAKVNTTSHKRFELRTSGSTGVVKTSGLFTGNALYTGSAALDDLYPTGNNAIDIYIAVTGNTTMASEKWVHFLKYTGQTTEFTWVDKTTVKKLGAFNADKRIYYATTGTATAATADMKIFAYHPTGGGAYTTLFQVSEAVSGYMKLVNARSEAITNAAPITGIVFDSGNNARHTGTYAHSGTGVYSGSFTLATGTTGQRIAEHVGTGQPFYIKFQPAGTNAPTATGATSWSRTSWWKVDVHPQTGTTLVADLMTNNASGEQPDYIISADLCFVWGHAQNARGEELTTDVQFHLTPITPLGTEVTGLSHRFIQDTTNPGWTKKIPTENDDYWTVTPTSPAGRWTLLLLAHKSGVNVSGTDPINNYGKYYDSPNWGFAREVTTGGAFSEAYPASGTPQFVNFISAFRDNITIEPAWGVSGQTGKWWASGDPIIVGFRVHKNGSGYRVDSGTTPRIKIGKLNQANGQIEYFVGSETIGVTMTHVESIYGGSADDFTWVYVWDTSTGVSYGNYVAQFNPSIDGAISYEHVLMKMNSGFVWQSDFNTYTGSLSIDFSPMDFSLYGVMKTYLNSGDDILAETHNYIQGIGRRDVQFQYSGAYITGLIIDNDVVNNVVAVTRSQSGVTSGKVTQTVETINLKLSGTSKTVTTDIFYNSSGKPTGASTNVT